MAFCFIHAADLHLDTPYEGLAVRDPALRTQLMDASLDALDGLVALAIERGALFVALAGDLYDGAVRGLRAQLRLLEATRRLDAAGIHTFIAHGNHDPVGEGWTAVRAWPERVHVFSAERAETFELVAADGTRVTVSGTSFPTAAVRQGLHARFTCPTGPGFHVAVLHASVGDQTEHAPYSPCTLADLVALGFDAWLLGHIHRRQTLRQRSPLVAYPGNLQGRSFKPSECGPKGASVVEVVRGEPTVHFAALAPVRFESVVVDVSACEDAGAVVDAVVAAAEPWAAMPGRVVARAQLVGRSPAYADLAGDGALEALLDALADRAGATPGVSWARITLDVQPVLDLAALRTRDDLTGALAREAEDLVEGPAAVRALLLNHAGTRDLLRDLSEAELAALTEAAAHLALHLLEGED